MSCLSYVTLHLYKGSRLVDGLRPLIKVVRVSGPPETLGVDFKQQYNFVLMPIKTPDHF